MIFNSSPLLPALKKGIIRSVKHLYLESVIRQRYELRWTLFRVCTVAKPTVLFNRLIFLTVRFGHPATEQISYKTIIGLTSHRIAAAPSKCKQYLSNNFVTALDFYRQRTTSPPPWNSFNGFFLWLHFLLRLKLNISLWFLGLLMQLKSEKKVIPTKIRCSLWCQTMFIAWIYQILGFQKFKLQLNLFQPIVFVPKKEAGIENPIC